MSRTSITQAIHGRVVGTFVLLLFQRSWTRVNRLYTALRKRACFKGILSAASRYVIPSAELPSPAALWERGVFVLGVAGWTPVLCCSLGMG